MKKKLPIILLGVILACVLVFGFLYANNDIGKTANSLEADIRQSQKILDDWIVDGSISDTMAAFISYPQDKTDHTFSVYVNRPGLSFGYFFRGGGDIVEVDDYIAEFVVEGNNERAFISMNTQNIVRLEVDDGNGIQVIDIDSGKPFAIVLPLNVGNICFYDTNGYACHSGSGLGQSDRQPYRRKIYPVLCRRVPFAFERGTVSMFFHMSIPFAANFILAYQISAANPT